MKFYVAAPWNQKPKVRDIQGKIRSSGHSIIADWTDHGKPEESEKTAEQLAEEHIEKDLKAVADSEVFILVSNRKSRGSHMEYGVAIKSMIETGKPQIYILGDIGLDYQFYQHPEVKRRSSIEEVLEEVDAGL